MHVKDRNSAGTDEKCHHNRTVITAEAIVGEFYCSSYSSALAYCRDGETLDHQGPHNLWFTVSESQITIDFILKFYLLRGVGSFIWHSQLSLKYLLVTLLRFDAILYSKLGNENSDAGHIKCSRGPRVPLPPGLLPCFPYFHDWCGPGRVYPNFTIFCTEYFYKR